MELTSFGSIMQFAIGLEEAMRSALDQAAGSGRLAPLRDAIGALREQNAGRLKLLERTRREGICEMVLHPIDGLKANDYAFSAPRGGEMTAEEFRSFLEGAGGRIAAFYGDAAEKLPADDAKRVFQKLAQKQYLVSS